MRRSDFNLKRNTILNKIEKKRKRKNKQIWTINISKQCDKFLHHFVNPIILNGRVFEAQPLQKRL